MDESKKTNRALALELLDRLVAFEIEREAMVQLLNWCLDTDTGKPLDWAPKVEKNCKDDSIQDSVRSRYAAIKQQMQGATSDCPDALSLLASISVNPVWKKAQ